MSDLPKPLTTGEIAQYCHVTHRAVLKWVQEEKIKAYRTPGHHSRIEVKDFLVFLRKYKMPIPAEFQDHAGGHKKVLIVDDDIAMVSSIKRILQMEEKYEIDVAYDGFSAGEKYALFKPDLVILDIKMPKLDGYQVCKHIRQQDKVVKIIVVSGIVEVDGVKKVYAMGADDYLPKPFKQEDLKNRIEKLLAK